MIFAVYEWLTNDPIGVSLFAFLRNLLYLWVIMFVLNRTIDHIFTKYNQSMGIKPDVHIWEELRSGNLAVAIYFGSRVAAILIGASIVASAFIK